MYILVYGIFINYQISLAVLARHTQTYLCTLHILFQTSLSPVQADLTGPSESAEVTQ